MPLPSPIQLGSAVKLLQVVHQFPPRHIGGTEIYVEGLSRALRDRGHEVLVFFGAEAHGEQLRDGLRLCSIKGGLDPSSSGLGTFFRAFGNQGVEDTFASLLRRERPDIVHFHHLAGLSPKLVEITRRAGVPSALTLHDYWFLCSNSQLVTPQGRICRGSWLGAGCGACAAYRLSRPNLVRLHPLAAPVFALRGHRVWQALKMSDVVVAPSRFIRDMFVRHGLPPSKILRVPLGIDAPAHPLTRRRTESKIRLAYLGSLARQKGVHILVEAFNEIDSRAAELMIYGDETVSPEYSLALHSAARNEGIHFMGKLPREDLWNTLAEVDVLAVPSLWYENFPLVVQEAFAAGVPVIASRIGGLAEQVSDSVDGLLFEPGNVSDFLDKVNILVDNGTLLEELRRAIQPVETMSHHVTVIEELYQLLRRGGDVGQLGAAGRQGLSGGVPCEE